MALQELSEIGQQFTRDIGSILQDRGQEAARLKMSEADGYRRAVRHILGASAEDAFVLGTQHSTGVFYFHPESERLLLARKEA